MKIGIFSDVHANLPALEAVLSFLDGKVDKYICCGDIVGYGPHPNECIKKIAGIDGIMCVAGNHDWAVLGLEDISKFNEHAAAAIKWTKSVLTDESQSYLLGLDYKLAGSGFIVVHGSLTDPIDQYVRTVSDYIPSMKKQDRRILFDGHTHQPLYFRATGGVVDFGIFIPGKKLEIADGSKYLVNVGSVGQPRDGDERSACVIYDTDEMTVELYRVEYDIKSVQSDMARVGLPRYLIERLEKGE
ncbi:MAG: metallophosphoesterase family protein [Elusimicrobia bacterium]|nr:metallophosphoesterase family protein [Elusimicrobiota bacterium]